MTKKTTITVAAALLAANISAADIYQGLGEGNSDLSTRRVSAENFAGVQPSIGDSVSRYQGWDEGNPDLFKADYSGPTDSGSDPDIYRTFPVMPTCNSEELGKAGAGIGPPSCYQTFLKPTRPAFERGFFFCFGRYRGGLGVYGYHISEYVIQMNNLLLSIIH